MIPQKQKFVHFFWIFFHLNYDYFQFYVRNIPDYIFGKIYDSFVF